MYFWKCLLGNVLERDPSFCFLSRSFFILHLYWSFFFVRCSSPSFFNRSLLPLLHSAFPLRPLSLASSSPSFLTHSPSKPTVSFIVFHRLSYLTFSSLSFFRIVSFPLLRRVSFFLFCASTFVYIFLLSWFTGMPYHIILSLSILLLSLLVFPFSFSFLRFPSSSSSSLVSRFPLFPL